MSLLNNMSSPEPKMPKRVVQTATPNMARQLPTDLAPPEPSPKSSAAAHALLLCQQEPTSSKNPSESVENEKKRPAPPKNAPTVAFPTPQQQMTHVTPSYPLPPGWHPQYALYPNHHHQQGESPFPVKRLKVSHADLTKTNTNSSGAAAVDTTAETTTPRQAAPVAVRPMPPPSQYFPTPYHMYAMNGMPHMAYGGGQVPFYVPSPMAPTTCGTNTSSDVSLKKPTSNTSTTTTSSKSVLASVTPTPSKKNYSRKTKSLGVLCENFIQTFSQENNNIIVIDNAATELGVERRRIYDVINILESLEIVQRKCKNTYEWLGVEHLTSVFGAFQQVAFSEFAQEAVANGLLQGNVQPRVPPHSGQKKSLGRLSQQFLQLFLAGNEVLSLTDAADKILGTPNMQTLHSSSSAAATAATLHAAAAKGLKTKIRRLYDISNVFCSLGICQKVEGGKNEKPKFAWDYKHTAKQIRELHLQTSQPTVSVYDPVAAAVLATTTPLLATTPSQQVVTTTTTVTRDETTSTTTANTLQEQGTVPTPVSDKHVLANINAMGGASADAGVEENEEPELCRTVSLASADL